MPYAFKNKHNATFRLPKFCDQIVVSEVGNPFRSLVTLSECDFWYIFFLENGAKTVKMVKTPVKTTVKMIIYFKQVYSGTFTTAFLHENSQE
jgi:hypothetical protein